MPTILVVEDDPSLLQLICEVLTLDHYRVLGVLQFTDPGQEYFGGAFDAVLIDIMLRGPVSGIELAHAIRRANPGTVLIAMSASNDMLETARVSGVFDHVFSKDDMGLGLLTFLESIGVPAPTDREVQ